MENKTNAGIRRVEPSLLLQPESLVTWSSVPGNSLYMPVPLESSNVNSMTQAPVKGQINSTSVTGSSEQGYVPSVSSEQYSPYSGSISQLQQPLMMCRSPSHSSPNVQNVPKAQLVSTSTMHSQEQDIQEHFPSLIQPVGVSQFSSSPNYVRDSLETTQLQQCYPAVQLNANLTVPASTIPIYNEIEKNEINSSNRILLQSVPVQSQRSTNLSSNVFTYQPVQSHWFFKNIVEQKELWYGFSPSDSRDIEEAYQDALKHNKNEEIVIPVVGGRYDIYVQQREKKAVYWDEKTLSVRRCTWFFKIDGVQRYLPYDERTASEIEELYEKCVTSSKWGQKLLLDSSEVILMEDPHTILHYAHGLDAWPAVVDAKTNPKIAFRGIPDGAVILPDEPKQIDHLVFVVQGIGSFCDLSFRTVYQCVDGFREIGNNLMPVHFKSEFESGMVGRVEFLPLAWHASLHTDDVGFDRQMKSITLPSIPKLRYFTNDTLLDILLYSSPMYCQAIIDTVTSGLNRLYSLFLCRNSYFKGHVSVAGHSLGSLILFDILANQTPPNSYSVNNELHDVSLSNFASVITSKTLSRNNSLPNSDGEEIHSESIEVLFEDLGLQSYLQTFLNEKMDMKSLVFCSESDLKDLGLPLGPRKKLLAAVRKQKSLTSSLVQLVDVASNSQPCDAVSAHPGACSTPSVYPFSTPYTTLSSVTFSRLEFHPACFFALGSPISMFLAVRGFSTISEDFCFPTCPSFYHIFHPYDPVAFRIEPLIDPKFSAKPVLIPHHKGRKRMHIEIRESITKMGSELKQRLLETLKFTWNHINLFSKGIDLSTEAVEAEVNKLVQQQIDNEIEVEGQASVLERTAENLSVGCLNRGRRIDYVLQEKPIEALNEYIFALTSHATYWSSEDTVLMILKEVYASEGIIPNPDEPKEYKNHDFVISSQRSSSEFFPPQMNNVNYKSNNQNIIPQETFLGSNVMPTDSVHCPLSTESPNVSDAHTMPPFSNLDSLNVLQPAVTASPVLGPPPLSGFVRKSPFSKP